MVAAARPITQDPPGLAMFMAATRQQESGSAQGNYREPNGGGAYQIEQSNWPSWARAAGAGSWANVRPSDAPPQVQDAVARYEMTSYYYGAGGQSWRNVARIWNGGSPNPRPNKALGPGATTDTYASQVLDKMARLPGGGAQATGPGGPGFTGAPVATDNVECYARTPSLKVAGVGMNGVCLDPLLFGGLIALGAVGFLAGAALLVVIVAGSKQGSKVVRGATRVAMPLKSAAVGLAGKAGTA